ncbi:hypothetical protein, partial [Pontibacterium sp.]|uniref:hypothetical protein n=1 Tax=Pontibacterium sp. TaxID=2036026 RepID=UPI0035146375
LNRIQSPFWCSLVADLSEGDVSYLMNHKNRNIRVSVHMLRNATEDLLMHPAEDESPITRPVL